MRAKLLISLGFGPGLASRTIFLCPRPQSRERGRGAVAEAPQKSRPALFWDVHVLFAGGQSPQKSRPALFWDVHVLFS
jgi:hypothetical protein